MDSSFKSQKWTRKSSCDVYFMSETSKKKHNITYKEVICTVLGASDGLCFQKKFLNLHSLKMEKYVHNSRYVLKK